ncbi:unnamed protein product [Orchesella dallaii]|uniref:Uncharacterized protein n=1 Tax=Orchesella dallaii TaxID=48710 RepID=A0ABP1PTG3_9HEXA
MEERKDSDSVHTKLSMLFASHARASSLPVVVVHMTSCDVGEGAGESVNLSLAEIAFTALSVDDSLLESYYIFVDPAAGGLAQLAKKEDAAVATDIFEKIQASTSKNFGRRTRNRRCAASMENMLTACLLNSMDVELFQKFCKRE